MKNENKEKFEKIVRSLFYLEVIVLVVMILFLIAPNINLAGSVIGKDNVTVITILTVGQVSPEILSIIVNNNNLISLTPNSTVFVPVNITARDYNNETDITNVTLRFFDSVASTYTGAEDNNIHYRNNSCVINVTYGDEYEISAVCTVALYYYANNATWNASINITDNSSRSDFDSNTSTVNILLALGLPSTIDYGTVNSTEVSAEVIANVTNFGNTMFNLTLDGYARIRYDNFSMNCSRGNLQNISIGYEKYNLTSSNASMINITQFESIYNNLTSAPVIRTFNSPQRQNDTAPYFDETNSTYWRMYVPVGVAGSCSGNIIFAAVQTSGS